MTAQPTVSPYCSGRSHPIPKNRILFGILGLFLLLLFLKNPGLAAESVKNGLRLSCVSVFPSVFPILILSQWVVESGLAVRLFRPLCKPVSRLLRLPPTASVPVLLGLFCGFPVGAKAAVSSWKNQTCTAEEAQRILSVSSNPSPAFLVGAVGYSLFGSKSFGLLLFGCSVLSAFAAVLIVTAGKKKQSRLPTVQTAEAAPASPIAVLTHSVTSATESCVNMCAYIIFFSAVSGAVSSVGEVFRLPKALQTAVFCLLELTNGVREASLLPHRFAPYLFAAFAVGWSGCSVHCQLLSLCRDFPLDYPDFFLSKLLQGIFCTVLTALAIFFFPQLTASLWH